MSRALIDPRLRRTFVIGGNRSHVFGTLAERLAEYGLAVVYHHDMSTNRPVQELPRDVEAVVLFSDMVATVRHGDRAKVQAHDRGIPFIQTTRKAALLAAACERAGLHRLPPRGEPEPVELPPADVFDQPGDAPDVEPGYLAFPRSVDFGLAQLTAEPNQWADTPDEARVLAEVVWPTADVGSFCVADRRGRLVTVPVAPPAPEPFNRISLPENVMAGPSLNSPPPPPTSSVHLSLKRGEMDRIEVALEKFNIIREVGGNDPLTLEQFIVRLVGDGITVQESKFQRLASLTTSK